MYCYKIYLYTIVIFCFLSCSTDHSLTNVEEGFIEITDDVGRVVSVPEKVTRVMALSPSMTELLSLLSPEKVVGRTVHCNYPSSIERLPAFTVYPKVNYEAILKMDLDVVFSMSNMTSPEVADKLTQLGVPVLLYKGESINEVNTNFIEISKVLNEEDKALLIIDSLTTCLNKISICNKQSAAIAIVSIDPIYVYGKQSILQDKMVYACLENAIGEDLGLYPQVSREYILKKNPDILIGKSFEYMDSTFFKLYPELKSINAYKSKSVYEVDGDLISRPTLRYLDLINELITINE